MRLTIIPSDNLVGVDGKFLNGLDLTSCGIPANIHAIQWYETEGEVEFVDNPDRTKPQNEIVSLLPDWANACVAVYKAYVPPAPPVIPASAQPATTGTKPA
jgi:hypothetical protein